LWAETTGPRPAAWFFKPLAAACFLWLAWLAGASESDYGRWLLAGLALCWLGDVLLIPDNKKSFLAGLGSFLTGHLLYAVAFLSLSVNIPLMLAALLPVFAFVFISLRWLKPHLPTAMRLPVTLYIIVISAMLLCAVGTWNTPAALWIMAGALGFAISDLAVARQQFVQQSAVNRLWGLPLYFASQMILAWSTALV
jgi:uncharacterized membrane protein YhhN